MLRHLHEHVSEQIKLPVTFSVGYHTLPLSWEDDFGIEEECEVEMGDVGGVEVYNCFGRMQRERARGKKRCKRGRYIGLNVVLW